MKTQITIENLKCEGCAGSIKKGLYSFKEVVGVNVDLERETVEVTFTETLALDRIREKLASMGYPEKGSTAGLTKLAASAKSYVSCAIGKFSKDQQDEKLSEHN
jgi:copper chaperone